MKKITQKTSNRIAICTYLYIITLNVNGLNVPIKRHRGDDWIKKQGPSMFKRLSLELKDTETKSERMEGDISRK